MSPELSRHIASIMGRHWTAPDERDAVIAAALDADTWGELPSETRQLLDEISRRGAAGEVT